MEFKLLSFGENGYPKDDKSLEVIHKILERKELVIVRHRPLRTVDAMEYIRRFNEPDLYHTCGVVTNLHMEIHKKGVDLFGHVKPAGRFSDMLVSGLHVMGGKLKLYPRMLTEEGLSPRSFICFDLFLSADEEVRTLASWSKQLHKRIGTVTDECSIG